MDASDNGGGGYSAISVSGEMDIKEVPESTEKSDRFPTVFPENIELRFDGCIIEDVRQRECLYNNRHEDFRNPDRKREAWVDIAWIAGAIRPCIPQDCERRWQLLRDRYTREKKQLELKQCPGETSDWIYFTQMSFMEPFVRHRRSQRLKYCPDANLSDRSGSSPGIRYDLGMESRDELPTQLGTNESFDFSAMPALKCEALSGDLGGSQVGSFVNEPYPKRFRMDHDSDPITAVCLDGPEGIQPPVHSSHGQSQPRQRDSSADGVGHSGIAISRSSAMVSQATSSISSEDAFGAQVEPVFGLPGANVRPYQAGGSSTSRSATSAVIKEVIDDDDLAFGVYVAAALKRMPDEIRKHYARVKVEQALFDAQFGSLPET